MVSYPSATGVWGGGAIHELGDQRCSEVEIIARYFCSAAYLQSAVVTHETISLERLNP